LSDAKTNTIAGSAESPSAACSQESKVLILGLGNMLLKDEGIGVHVAQRLQEQSLPSSIEVIDGGTASLDVLLPARNAEKLVVIDAMRAGGKPGTIYKIQLKAEGIDKLPEIFSWQESSKISLHQIGLVDALAAADRMNCAPKQIIIIGVEPAELDYGLELTNEVSRKVPEIIEMVLKEIKDDIHPE
jgi:hydrogenase maturation protease